VAGRQYTNPETSPQATRRWGGGLFDDPTDVRISRFRLSEKGSRGRHAFDGFVAEVRKTLHGWGRDLFEYLVNNAGGSLHANFDQTTEAQFDEIVNVHFKGVYFLTQKLLPLIKDGGRIVNIHRDWRALRYRASRQVSSLRVPFRRISAVVWSVTILRLTSALPR